MDIETLEEIKQAAQEALKGRKKLAKMSAAYIALTSSGGMTRARTTTYNARAADVMENQVKPNIDIINKLVNPSSR